MDTHGLVDHVREHYIDQFREFVELVQRQHGRFATEVKIALNDPPNGQFEDMFCVDIVAGHDRDMRLMELDPEFFISFDTIELDFGGARLFLESLRWNNVLFVHDGDQLQAAALSAWFRKWFDPADERQGKAAGLGNVIHSLNFAPGLIAVDFGTAETHAFWEMLAIIEGAGARDIRVTTASALPLAH
jgi:hypothetical protein